VKLSLSESITPAGADGGLSNGRLFSGVRQVADHIAAVSPVADRMLRARRLRYRMRKALGYDPNFRSPRTFNEKLAWRMLYDRNPLFPLTIDKIAVRDYVAAKVGPEILIPLLGTWNRAADVPWAGLPRRFVLKASHGWNMNLLVTDKDSTDGVAALQTADVWLRNNHFLETHEWGYRDIPPRLLAEEMLLDAQGKIPEDFKFFVFGGQAKLLEIHTGRFGDHRTRFFDADLQPLPIAKKFPADPNYVLPPETRDLARLAERLGADFDFARIDLYLARGRAWFGEITHYDGSACSPFAQPEHDRIIGDMWQLPRRGPTSR
jgi:hypothetical protein